MLIITGIYWFDYIQGRAGLFSDIIRIDGIMPRRASPQKDVLQCRVSMITPSMIDFGLARNAKCPIFAVLFGLYNHDPKSTG
jgi:hypothetical protein